MTLAAADRPAATAAAALRLAEPELALRPLLVVSDFDGTISPIVSDPWGARPLGSAQRALRRLAGRPDVHVAILSGRTAADVAARVRVGGATYLGNHGVERGRLARRQRAVSLAVSGQAEIQGYAAEAERLARGVAERIGEPWLIVERKAPAVAFHFRNAPDVPAAAEAVLGAVDALDPRATFTRFPGRRVLELRPPGATHKGEALKELLTDLRPQLCFVLGDDVSDADAFRVLHGARDAGQVRGLALAVQAHAEAPVEVARAADVLLGSPLEAARFLSGLARRIG